MRMILCHIIYTALHLNIYIGYWLFMSAFSYECSSPKLLLHLMHLRIQYALVHIEILSWNWNMTKRASSRSCLLDCIFPEKVRMHSMRLCLPILLDRINLTRLQLSIKVGSRKCIDVIFLNLCLRWWRDKGSNVCKNTIQYSTSWTEVDQSIYSLVKFLNNLS